jgi:hypothetical protein
MNELRSACRHRIDLSREQLFRRMQRPRTGAEQPRAQPRTGPSDAAPASGKPAGSGGQA